MYNIKIRKACKNDIDSLVLLLMSDILVQQERN